MAGAHRRRRDALFAHKRVRVVDGRSLLRLRQVQQLPGESAGATGGRARHGTRGRLRGTGGDRLRLERRNWVCCAGGLHLRRQGRHAHDLGATPSGKQAGAGRRAGGCGQHPAAATREESRVALGDGIPVEPHDSGGTHPAGAPDAADGDVPRRGRVLHPKLAGRGATRVLAGARRLNAVRSWQ